MTKHLLSSELVSDSILTDNYTTNRILEIPQNIDVELNDGILVLKAGSKVCVPNGFEEDGVTKKFDIMTITSDLTYIEPGTNVAVQAPVSFFVDTNKIYRRGNNQSGETLPDNFSGLFYNTTTNFCQSWDGQGNAVKCSLPICIVTSNGQSNNNIASIDQVFNGVGYIGQTIFSLPNIKVILANGRNEDGSYKTISIKTNDVATFTVSGTGIKDVLLQSNGLLNQATGGVYFADDGYVRNYVNGNINLGIVLAKVNVITAGTIDSFLSYEVDSMANSGADNFSKVGRSQLSFLTMPSSKYIDLTLGTSGTKYTAPANGYFNLMKMAASNAQNIHMTCNDRTDISWGSTTNVNVSLMFPVGKGDIVTVTYSTTGKTERFRFFYANGDL